MRDEEQKGRKKSKSDGGREGVLKVGPLVGEGKKGGTYWMEGRARKKIEMGAFVWCAGQRTTTSYLTCRPPGPAMRIRCDFRLPHTQMGSGGEALASRHTRKATDSLRTSCTGTTAIENFSLPSLCVLFY